MDIGEIIRSRAAANGVDAGTLARIAQIESGMNPSAAAKGSSARGLMQFTRGTWDQYGNGADPMDATASADAGARLLKDNATALKAAGIEPTPSALYLSHFAGSGGARKLLTADPSQPAASVLGDDAVRSNPFLAKMSVTDLKNWASGKMGEEAAPAAAAPTSQPTEAAPSGLLNSTPAERPDTGTDQALAQLKRFTAGQQPEAPAPLQIQAPPPQRRIDQAALLKMLSSPLRAGFALG